MHSYHSYIKRHYLLALLLFALSSCKKYLDPKPDAALVVPQKVQDLQALLDNNGVMNLSVTSGEVAADNYYLTDVTWAALPNESDKNAYIWGDELFYSIYPNDWSRQYSIVYYSNLALQYIETMVRTSQNQADWDNVKGSALFYRAAAFAGVAASWAKAYDLATANNDLGIPLRLDPDFNIPSIRASNKNTYDLIINDLQTAIGLLPNLAIHPMRPSRASAFAMLARVYLCTGDYTKAGACADSALRRNSVLLDYNTLTSTSAYPIAAFNSEVLFHAVMAVPAPLVNTRALIDSALYSSYAANDLRKAVFFRAGGNSTFAFKGSYNASSILFTGIATDEMYLTKAEVLARTGKKDDAIAVLNALLVKRWKTGTFVPLTAVDEGAALALVLTERRKELLMRGTRWADIKRLNKSGSNITLKRVANGTTYQLAPNDNRFALPIPSYVIDLTNMSQNPR